ncbi:phage tail-collar fiber domain-containing protein [Pseudoalteromonas sp. S16_S37]|uniref:phage tail-collar fiber domain-containing protein n=1 Tax=Pseudoalteromonas sp. S16_S37 TaxID=2720228 RepID=UPI001680CC60|nr:hypothetical protein [Pseudoalteromonas sp. S16_S37]
MSTLTITNAGLDYKNAVLAGVEQPNITHMLFANVPNIDVTSAPSANSVVPSEYVVHSQSIERVSNLDGNALVISAVLDYSLGDFTFNWYGAVATKADGSQVLVAVVHTHDQTKTKTDGPNIGDYSVKSIVWQSQQLGQNVAVNIATQPWQLENDAFATQRDKTELTEKINDLHSIAYTTNNKPTPADVSAKLARYESSLIDVLGHDFKIRDKRALVGFADKLIVNYDADWSQVEAKGTWNFLGDIVAYYDIKMAGSDSYIWSPNITNGSTGIYDPYSNITALKYTNGKAFDFGADINITKNNPWLTLKSSSEGNDNTQQAAGISLGESGRENKASLHLSYIGNGSSYIGMGTPGADNIPDNWAMQMHYQSTWVRFRNEIQLVDDKTRLNKGDLNALRVVTDSGYVDIGAMNSDFCHFQTDRPRFYLDKPTFIRGEIYAGSNYDQRVYHQGYKPSADDVGAFVQNWGITPTVNTSEFTTIAKINGSNLASSITLQLKGTTGSTVVNVKADILVNHHKDITVDSMSGGYTPIQLRIICNGNEKYIIQAKTLNGNPLPLICSIQSHTKDAVSIGSYSTDGYTIEHIHTTEKNKRSLSSINGTGLLIDNNPALHTGNVHRYSEARTVLSSGALAANSKNHLTATDTFTLPAVANLSEGATVVVSKAMAATPTIKVQGRSEHIAMMQGTKMLTDDSVQFDTHTTLTFILNADKNWEMQ